VKDSAFTGAVPLGHSGNGTRQGRAGDGPPGRPGRGGRPAPARGRRRAAGHGARGDRRGGAPGGRSWPARSWRSRSEAAWLETPSLARSASRVMGCPCWSWCSEAARRAAAEERFVLSVPGRDGRPGAGSSPGPSSPGTSADRWAAWRSIMETETRNAPDGPGPVGGPLQRTVTLSQPSPPPASTRPPRRRPLPQADPAPARPRRPRRVRASRIEAQLRASGRVLEPRTRWTLASARNRREHPGAAGEAGSAA
jgi:hypothetical protein